MILDITDIGINLNNLGNIIYILKTAFISICTYYTLLKITNQKKLAKLKNLIVCISIFIMSIFINVIKIKTNSIISTMCLVFILSLIISAFTKCEISYTILTTVFSLAINYLIFLVAIIIIFIINLIKVLKNDFVNPILMMFIHLIILSRILKINKLKYGISFLNRKLENDYLDILILNISVSVIFSIILFTNFQLLLSKSLFFGLIIFAIVMFITIQKSLQLYYKQKLLIQELKETKSELEAKKKEVEELEKENLEFSKTSHTLAHKQRILEHKIEELSNKSEAGKEISVAEENNIKDTVQKISKELYTEVNGVELYKTEIPEIDDILKYMQSECIKNKIEFNVQIRGNIYKMINNIIPKEELQILIADHVKNAIIAINHSENINRSILLQVGKIMNSYGIYVYDSGIEFEKETLENLGKRPSTTHAEDGGTGMGFMNTFDTLRKYKASLEIEEIGNPSKDNYTKILKIKFDEKEEYKVKSYRENIVKKYNL